MCNMYFGECGGKRNVLYSYTHMHMQTFIFTFTYLYLYLQYNVFNLLLLFLDRLFSYDLNHIFVLRVQNSHFLFIYYYYY